MCGIFGAIQTDPLPADYPAEAEQINSQRGTRGFGCLYGTAENTTLFRTAAPFNPTPLPATTNTLFLAHLRAPTGTAASDPRTLHPLHHNNLFLAHNGILLNHTDFPHWALWPELPFDSQHILGGIMDHYANGGGGELAAAIAATAAKLNGQQACWLWNATTQSLFLWRVMAPLYYNSARSQTSEAYKLRFSSLPTAQCQTALPEGVVGRFTIRDGFNLVANFSFYSPYQV